MTEPVSESTDGLTARPCRVRLILEPLDMNTPHSALGTPRDRWLASATHVDMARPRASPRELDIASTPQAVTIDLNSTALIVINMQNHFCAPAGMVGLAGGD